MKKILSIILLAFVAFASVASAGALSTVPQGQGAGRTIKSIGFYE